MGFCERFLVFGTVVPNIYTFKRSAKSRGCLMRWLALRF
jgi:hypothetical protein